MKLSVLLPTRNGAHLLSHCVASVLAQPTEDLDLVVSDNASTDDTQAILESYRGDPRLRVLTPLPRPVPVTENWQRALAECRGDYVLLIGDDDYLLPEYWDRAHGLLERYDYPEVLSYNAYGFAFPGAIGDGKTAWYADPLFAESPALPAEGTVPAPQRRSLVEGMFRFQFGLCLNTQTTLVARRALERLPRGPFHPPFPDFYAVNALLLTAETWVHTRERLVIVGISPKSFGATFQRMNEGEALKYLGVSTAFPRSLPGHEMINGTVLCAERLKADLPDELNSVSVSWPDYVYTQVSYWYRQWRVGTFGFSEIARLLKRLSLRDWKGLLEVLRRRASRSMLRRNLRIDPLAETIRTWPALVPAAGIQTAPDLAARLRAGSTRLR